MSPILENLFHDEHDLWPFIGCLFKTQNVKVQFYLACMECETIKISSQKEQEYLAVFNLFKGKWIVVFRC